MRVKWGSGISAEDIDNAEDKSIEVYDGPIPPRGVYGFNIKSMKIGKTNNDNPQFQIGLELNPRNRTDHKKYAGFFLMDFIVVLPQTAFKIKPLLAALGVSSQDFTENTIVNEEGEVTQIGKVKPVGKLIVARLQDNRGQSKDSYPREIGGYLPKAAGREAEHPGDSDAGDSDDGDMPF
jgi:hypothetical protein